MSLTWAAWHQTSLPSMSFSTRANLHRLIGRISWTRTTSPILIELPFLSLRVFWVVGDEILSGWANTRFSIVPKTFSLVVHNASFSLKVQHCIYFSYHSNCVKDESEGTFWGTSSPSQQVSCKTLPNQAAFSMINCHFIFHDFPSIFAFCLHQESD